MGENRDNREGVKSHEDYRKVSFPQFLLCPTFGPFIKQCDFPLLYLFHMHCKSAQQQQKKNKVNAKKEL